MRDWLRRVLPVLVVVALVLLLWPRDPAAPGRPNILLIMLDDFGYNDLGANGNPDAVTPALDRFAAEGIRYTRHYAEPTCSVARVAMLTGTYPSAFGFRPARLGLSAGTPTIASVLRDAGYHTRHIGKWHVGNPTLEQSPGRLGFDEWFGFLFQSELGGPTSAGRSFSKPTYNNPWLRRNNAAPRRHEGHLTDLLTDEAVAFLQSREPGGEPWFLNLWYYAPHTPLEPAERFRKQYPEGSAGDFHALVAQLDASVARVLQTLEDNDMAEDTLVLIVSDNGGTNKAMNNNAPFFGHKGQLLEGALRTPLLLRWPGHVEAGAVSGELVSLYDAFPTLAAAAGAAPPAGLIGRNLLAQDLPASPQLFHEASGLQVQSYSVLSRDGRWRLTRGSEGSLLFDLESDPSGLQDVLAEHPEIAAALTAQYLEWHRSTRVVQVSYEPLNGSGGALLRGDDVQRSPGYRGFTFAIGVTPAADAGRGIRTIAEQAGRWHLRHDGEQGLDLDVLGITVTAPALPVGVCSEIVVATHFKLSPVRPQRNVATINLFVDGALADRAVVRQPRLDTWGMANPTYVGFAAAGDGQFAGELTRPLILNEGIVPDSADDGVGNGISQVPATCARVPAPASAEQGAPRPQEFQAVRVRTTPDPAPRRST